MKFFKKFLIITILGAMTAPSTLFCQFNDSSEIYTNRVSVQTGLIHYFFDKTPIINVKHQNKEIKPFNGTLYNSIGAQYSRRINLYSFISIEYNYFYEIYENVYQNQLKNIISERQNNTFNINYNRLYSLQSKFILTYGIGVNFRYGMEHIVVNYGYFPYLNAYEPMVESRIEKDFGLNLRGGLQYSPLKWLTLYCNLDMIGFLILNDNETIKKLQETYNYTQYPHRIDLSLRFGVGVNF